MVASFLHQIKSEYYGRNWYVYIEGIVLENCSAPTHPKTATTTLTRTHNDVFHSFLSDDSKHYAVTTIAHIKYNI